MLLLLTLNMAPFIKAEYLSFSYSSSSPNGPLNWTNVDISNSEWMKYSGRNRIDPQHNLNVHKNTCDRMRFQSPINLVPNLKCTDNHEIMTHQIHEDDCLFENLTFEITPTLLKATFPESDDVCTRPTIDIPNGVSYSYSTNLIILQ